MASWVLAHPPWHSLARVRIRWDTLVKAGGWTRPGRHFLNTPTLSLRIDLDEETPSMRQIKAYPYPSAPPDSSLFEEATDEYATAALTESEATLFDIPAGAPPCTLLKCLVKAQRYEDAERVYTELVALGIEINPHPVYHFIARRTLSTPGLASQKRLDTFMKWWSLVPASSEIDCSRSVGFILTELLRKDHSPDIPLIASFALLAASKGYAIQVGLDSIRRIARYAPSDFTTRFLEEFCVTTWNYETKAKQTRQGPPSRRALDLIQSQFRIWYNAAVSSLVDSGKHRSALQLLKLAHSRKLSIKQGTYEHIVSVFQAHGYRDAVHAVQQMNRGMSSSSGNHETSDLPTEFSAPQDISTIYLPLRGHGTELAKSARSIKRAFQAGILVPAIQLTEVITVFLQSDRKSALRRLRNLAYRSGPSAISTWALAEMTFYANRNYFQSLLHVFEQHFDHVGVPPEIFDPIHFSEQRHDLTKVKVPAVALQQIGPVPSIYRRLPPSKEHTYLLWRMAVKHAKRPASAARLYRAFVNVVTETRSIPRNVYPLPRLPSPVMPPAEGQNMEYLRPMPPRILYDARYFDVFVNKFFSYGFISYATRVIVDMFCLGFAPHIRTRDAFMKGLMFKPGQAAVERRLQYWQKTVDRAIAQAQNLPGRSASPEQLRGRMLSFFFRATVRRLMQDGRRQEAIYVAQHLTQVASARSELKNVLKRDLGLRQKSET
ncbi:hypothetical protein BD309DRAFT_1022803 [Dichomitus squalens]|nr:hypothetical protein BD309DRAFT_1022803 [Dichomitus squalens]